MKVFVNLMQTNQIGIYLNIFFVSGVFLFNEFISILKFYEMIFRFRLEI